MIKVLEEWKQENELYACPICNKEYTKHGIVTHIYRTHNNGKASSGNNGRYKDKEYKEKLAKANRDYHNKIKGEFKEFNVICNNCGIEFKIKEREKLFPIKKKYFCSRSCANTRIHSEETKQKIGNTLKDITFPNRKRPLKTRICPICKNKFHKKRKFCSDECLSIHKRRNMSELVKYRSECSFKFSLNDYPDKFDFSLIEKYGWYKAKNRGNNLNGISRDHNISVKYGFDNKILPEIISHPANCQLMRHNDNVSKNSNCGITLKELKKKIQEW